MSFSNYGQLMFHDYSIFSVYFLIFAIMTTAGDNEHMIIRQYGGFHVTTRDKMRGNI